jgi:hypothetical protein
MFEPRGLHYNCQPALSHETTMLTIPLLLLHLKTKAQPIFQTLVYVRKTPKEMDTVQNAEEP